MEIEGVINHTLMGLQAKHDVYQKSINETVLDSYLWTCLRIIHTNHEVQEAIKNITNVRELFGIVEYMKEFLKNDPEDSFKFLGFHLEHIQLYIELRESCKSNETSE